MAPRSRDMTNLDQPLTSREFRDFRVNLDARLQNFATKEDLHAVRGEMAEGFAEMRAYVEASVNAARDELRTHFDVVAESFRSEFRHLYDWTHTTTSSLSARVESLETDHGAQITSLDTRVTRLETDDRRRARRSRG